MTLKHYIRYICLIILVILAGCDVTNYERDANDIAQWAIDQIVVTEDDIVLVDVHPEFDASIEWSADKVELIDFTTKKLIASFTDQTIVLSVKVTYQGFEIIKTKQITIPKIDDSVLEETALEIAEWAIDHVTSNISVMNLPMTHPNYDASIIWSIDHPTLPIVNNQIRLNGEACEFELTVTVIYQTVEKQVSKSFEFEEYDISSVERKFVNQFFDIISRNYNVRTTYTDFGGSTITWYSSNPTIFSNEGVYRAPFYNTQITIHFTVETTNPAIIRTFQADLIVLRMTSGERLLTIQEAIHDSLGQNIVVSLEQLLPTELPTLGLTLTWLDQYGEIISKLNEVTSYIIPRVGTDLTIIVSGEDGEFPIKYRLQTEESNDSFVMRKINSIDLVKEIKVGWNIGNTLDAPSETAWGNPMISKALLDKVKAAGFNIIRIPVTWEGKFNNSGDYIIDQAYLDRVQEVVNYAIDDNTFVILNMHHERWNTTTYANLAQASIIMEKLWTQIGNRFKDYDEHLIFEGMNEPRFYEGTASEQWTGKLESFSVINSLNQVFVDTIRSLGGNNRYRHLMITTNGAGTSDYILSNLVVPNDPYVIVSVHSYAPYDFAHDKTTVTTWSASNSSQTSVISSVFTRLNHYFISKNIAVIMGEFSSRDKNNLSSRLAWLDYYLNQADTYGIPCVWWDTGQLQTPENMTFSILNRNTLEWIFPDIVERLTR